MYTRSNPGNNLHVSGLNHRVDTRALEAAFAKIGRVKKASVMYDPHTRESRGFGFVTMESAEEADAAITALNSTELMGKTMTVEKARRGRARTPTPGRYYGPPKRNDCSMILAHTTVVIRVITMTVVDEAGAIATMTAGNMIAVTGEAIETTIGVIGTATAVMDGIMTVIEVGMKTAGIELVVLETEFCSASLPSYAAHIYVVLYVLPNSIIEDLVCMIVAGVL
ncbi:hypothetical protein C0992_001321 [Termitomyces sp. T32_za158]|nr:hypothetical protein C0992_001321 [Termitomyces sp. T32_za158]